MADRKRVVVTGMGCVTPVGNDVESYWASLKAGKSGLGLISKFDNSDINTKVVAEVKDLDYDQHFDKKENRKLEDFTKFSLIASRQAAADSGLLESGVNRELIGCVMGVGIGGIGFIEDQVKVGAERGLKRVSPILIPKIIANIAPGNVSIDLQIKGPNMAIVTACAAGTNAIGEAASIIQRGDAIGILAGGSEASICAVGIAGFENMHALATGFEENPTEASRPFDKGRCGFVMGEGSGMLMLEDYDHAVARGAKIYAEICGYGLSSDAHHITAPAPDGEGGARAMASAIRHAGIGLDEIGYCNAHGTSTPLNDKNETSAIKTVFGDLAYKLKISSNKSMIGHLLGAAGAVEAIATVKTLQDQIAPPTLNQIESDPDCDLDYVPNEAAAIDTQYAISNSLGFGGHNCTLVFGRV